MLCIDCGIHFPSGRTVCAVCGSELREAAKAIMVPARPNRGERDPLEDSLWPPPTVFILEDEENSLLEVPGVPIGTFEDAQADDVFEQSLSGVKLEELIEEEEEAFAVAVNAPTSEAQRDEPEPRGPSEELPDPPAAEPADIAETAIAAAPAVAHRSTEPTRDFEPLIAPAPASVAEAGEPEYAGPDHTTGKKFLKAFAALSIFSAVFAAGVALGFWYAGVDAAKVGAARLPIEPPADPKPQTPVPPEGMVYVPGGNFLMGSDEAEVLSRPAHFISVRPYFIDRTEVTNEQYRRFVEATGYDTPPSWKDGAIPAGEEQIPVTGVNWYDAAAYAAWAGKRLPTEAEWEFAARGADGRKYPWGNDWDASLANVEGRSNGLRRVGETEASALGIHDMAGNAWEWTANDARSYPGGKEFPWSRLKLKIIRGGNWKSNRESAAATFRGYYGASGEKDYSSTSFRCVKDLEN